jgi:hypothetical protein
MRHGTSAAVGGTAAAVSIAVLLFTFPISGQSGSVSGAQAATNRIPRMADGHPDFQGTYDIATITPIERPAGARGRLSLSEQEAAAVEGAEKNRVFERALPSDPNRDAPPLGGNVGGYNNFWIARGDRVIRVDGTPRSSLIVDPSDGRIPALTTEARQRNASLRFRNGPNPEDNEASPAAADPTAFDNPEQRPLGERCLLGFGSTSGPPTLPNYFYNNLKQIVQTPATVTILVEMVHDARIIRMNQPHLPSHVRKWMGDSVGRWEGDTLVVDTTNFTSKTRFRGSTDNLHVVERFWYDADGVLMYRFTVDDPHTWEKPWTGEFPWPRTSESIYEYACHEGNHALEHIMRGARALEREKQAGTGNR